MQEEFLSKYIIVINILISKIGMWLLKMFVITILIIIAALIIFIFSSERSWLANASRDMN